MQRLRIVPRTLVWAFEFVATIGIYGLVIMAIYNMFSGDGDSFMNGFLFVPISAGLGYVASGVVMFVGWLFNFLTKYDDYYDFGDMWDSILYAPLHIVKHAVVHPIRNIKLLFSGDPDDWFVLI